MTAVRDPSDRASGARDSGAVALLRIWPMVLIAGLLGLFGYDGVAIMAAHVKAESSAQDAATAASHAWHTSHDISAAYQAAVMQVAGAPEKVLTRGFAVDPDGTVHLLLRRRADTLLFSRVGPLEKYTTTIQHGDADDDSS